MTLTIPTLEETLAILPVRNANRNALRTYSVGTKGSQTRFYEDIVVPRDKHLYWSIKSVEEKPLFLGFGGLTNVSYVNGIAEISLLIMPQMQHKGLGFQAVGLLLKEAFENLRLQTVFGECYACGPKAFWVKVAHYYKAYTTHLPSRKFWEGSYHPSFYFSIDRSQYEHN